MPELPPALRPRISVKSLYCSFLLVTHSQERPQTTQTQWKLVRLNLTLDAVACEMPFFENNVALISCNPFDFF